MKTTLKTILVLGSMYLVLSFAENMHKILPLPVQNALGIISLLGLMAVTIALINKVMR